MTVNEIMELVGKYGGACIDLHDDVIDLASMQKSKEALRTAIEELTADATKWREYKARKDAAIAAGMGRSPLRKEST